MPTGSSQRVVSIGGVTFTAGSGTVTKDHANIYGDGTSDIAMPAGLAVTGWTYTSASQASATLPAGHGYTTGKVDVAWTSGGGGRRWNVDATISGNSITLAGGLGDNYPASGDLTVVVCARLTINTAIDGDLVGLYAANCSVASQLTFCDSGGAIIAHRDLMAGTVDDWYPGNGVANPLTGNPIAVCYASNKTTNNKGILFIGTLEDSTPATP